MISKAVPEKDRKPIRNHAGNRLMTAPDPATMNTIYRGTARRNRDNQITLQLLPDLGLCFDILVSLTMAPHDMFSDSVSITSDSSDLLPASVTLTLLQETTDYFNKKHELTNFIERMLYRVMRDWGALPQLIIPENALDDVINNYNDNLHLGLESFRKEIDTENNTVRSKGLLGVPEYLRESGRQKAVLPKHSAFARGVSLDLQAYDTYREPSPLANHDQSFINFSKLLGTTEVSTEAWHHTKGDEKINPDRMVFVTDNISAIKLPEIRDMATRSRVANLLSKNGIGKLQKSLESAYKDLTKHVREVHAKSTDHRKLNDDEIEKLIFKDRKFAHTPTAVLRNNASLQRTSIGEPLVRELDTACFIPVSIAGDPTRKLGGFIMLDEDGNPLTSSTAMPDEIQDLSSYANGKGNFVSSLNERAKEMYSGKDCNPATNFMTKKFLSQVTSDVMSKDLIDRLKNGYYDNGFQLGYNEDFYWMMFTRVMQGNRTTVLWVPAEYLVYFALEYDDFGFGKSMLDDMRNLTSMRIMMMIAGLTTTLRNSIGRTKVSVQLDEEDPDAEMRLEEIQDEIVKSRVSPIPFGINNIADISKYIQRACYEFEISGNSGISEMKIDFEQFNTNYPKPDEELTEELKNLSIQRLSLTRDTIDQSQGADFAIQAATSNRLTMKRIQRIQRTMEPQIAESLRKRAANSESQLKKYREIIETNWESFQVEKLKSYFGIEDDSLLQTPQFKKMAIEQVMSVYIMNLMVELPSPASSTLEDQHTAYTAARNFYEEVIKDIISDSFFDPTFQGDDASTKIAGIRESIVSLYMRRWLADNNVLPEVSELTRFDENGNVATNALDELEKHLKALGMSVAVFLRRFKKHAATMGVLMAEISDSTTTGTDTGSSDDGGGGGGGDDDLFGDMDMSMDEEPTDENAEEETVEEETTEETSTTDEPADGE
jgi:hypothetical protein